MRRVRLRESDEQNSRLKRDETVNFDLKTMRLLAMPVLLGLMQLASAQNEPAAPAGAAALFDQYPTGSIKSVPTADAALAATSKEQDRTDIQLIRDERVCYKKFFVSYCLAKVRDQHRAESKKIKNIEIEANTYLRQARADDRDQALADQRAQELADAPRRAEEQKKNALANAQKIQESTQRSAEADARAQAPTASPDQRIAEHEKKMQQVRAQQEADAKMHDANVAAYQKKVKDAQDRQKEVAAKKAQKAADEAAAKAAGQK